MRLSDIMSHMHLTTYPIIGLVIFLIVFVAIAARALSRRRAGEYLHAAGLPLEDDALPRGEALRSEGGGK
jgi:cbb3-type cytochrome oxidase subunit 3